jgi:hypothetical protein
MIGGAAAATLVNAVVVSGRLPSSLCGFARRGKPAASISKQRNFSLA